MQFIQEDSLLQVCTKHPLRLEKAGIRNVSLLVWLFDLHEGVVAAGESGQVDEAQRLMDEAEALKKVCNSTLREQAETLFSKRL